MTTPQLVIAGCLAVLGIVHSALGETEILRPLFAAEWQTAIPRSAIEKILRFAWHLTSIAWYALAAIILEVDAIFVIATMSFVSAATIFVVLRTHLAWPLFLLAGLAALYESAVLEVAALRAITIATAAVLTMAAAVHVYWAAGGRWLSDQAAPAHIGDKTFQPGPLATLAVAATLTGFAALILMTAFERGPAATRWFVVAGIAVLVLRAIGDTRVVGFTKKTRHTVFGQADDRYFTPLVVFLAFGATAALLT
jgi:hypothetical protein